MRIFLFSVALLVVAVISIAGYRGMKTPRTPIEIFPDMDRQPKVKAQTPSTFFPDGEAARLPVAGTVSRREPAQLDYYSTGKLGDRWGTGMPFEITLADMQRGQERFNIYCSVCHGADARGDGIVKGFGLATIVSLQDDRIRNMADGEIFNTITHGKNTMGPYGANISVEDRWRVIAYLRALQMSQGTAVAQLPPDLQDRIESSGPVPAPAPPPSTPPSAPPNPPAGGAN